MRRHYQFFGDVQGVGFRYWAAQAARDLGITGWVRNEYDGSVEMEAQGTEEELDHLPEVIGAGRYVDISHMDVKQIAEIEGERGFSVRY